MHKVTVLAGTYWVVFVWGLGLLASWIGWGELVAVALKVKREEVGWGLRAVWGMAVVLGLGGVLMMAGVCDLRVLVGMVVVGAVVAGVRVYQYLTKPRGIRVEEGRGWSWGWWVVGLLLVYCYATSVIAFDVNWWDDLIAYLVFAKKLMQTGGMIEPYSLRRMVTFGGQPLLDGMVMAGGNYLNVDVLELGLGQIVFAGILVEMMPRGMKRRGLWAAVIVLVLLLVPRGSVPWLNTTSEMTGVVLFMGMIRTLELAAEEGGAWKMAAMAGVVGAGFSTMRANFVPAAVLGILFCYGVRMAMERREWKRHLGQLGVAAAAYGVVLLPWAVALWESSGTLFYPLWRGNGAADFAFYRAGLTATAKAGRVAGFFVYPLGVGLMLPMVLAVRRRFWRTELGVGLAAVLTTAATLLGDTVSAYLHVYRYIFPMAFGVTAVVVVRTCMEAGWRKRVLGVAGLVLIGAVNVAPSAVWWFGARSRSWREEEKSPLMGVVQSADAYREAQGEVPAGRTIFSATSFPVLFDYARNRIFLADIQGAVSPPPGMPVFAGAQAVASYLRREGVGYVIFTDPGFDRTQYSMGYWREVMAHPEKFEPEKFHVAPLCLKFLEDMEGLEAQGRVVYRKRSLRVVALNEAPARPSGPPASMQH